jgi:hypothetical protein
LIGNVHIIKNKKKNKSLTYPSSNKKIPLTNYSDPQIPTYQPKNHPISESPLILSLSDPIDIKYNI